MFLNSVVIILREVLEASIIVSLLLALSFRFRVSKRWLVFGIPSGALTAVLYGIYVGEISNWWEGIGQEVVNVGLHGLIYIFLLVAVVALRKLQQQQDAVFWNKVASLSMIAIAALSFAREGGEMYLYIAGFVQSHQLQSMLVMGTFLGAAIGFSVGALLYIVLTQLKFRCAFDIGLVLLALVSAGMCLQGAQLLTQVDILPMQAALWNSDQFLPEHSLLGQLLYATLGYESTPTPAEAIIYLLALFTFSGVNVFYAYRTHRFR